MIVKLGYPKERIMNYIETGVRNYATTAYYLLLDK